MEEMLHSNDRIISVGYLKNTDIPYLADGKITVELEPSSAQASDIVMYFADDDGIMDAYAHLQKQPLCEGQTSIEFDTVAHTLIPQGAKYIYVYTSRDGVLSDGYAVITLPEGASDYDFGKPLLEFQVVSDIHVTEDNDHRHNLNFRAMLEDVATNCPDSIGIFANGDTSNTGKEEEYANVRALHASVANAPKLYCAAGNHDMGSPGLSYEGARDRFSEFVGEENSYYDKWVGGLHFIFLAPENRSCVTQLSDAQLAWLEDKLSDGYTPGKPIFIFLHQGLFNIVSGGLPGQKWDGVGACGEENDLATRLKNILKKYRGAVFFSGHSHWELNSVRTMYYQDENMCHALSTASVGYLWTSYGDTNTDGRPYPESNGGSQGYYAELYGDKLIFRGRDFAEGKWMPSATFVIELN